VSVRHFIIGTAGHVDHGKSALVKALTGTDPDRLPEEKKRQITIDLGFAELNLAAPNGERIHAGIVDVPGHEDFVRNMIAGVGSIDLALFAIAADDGWMPQTEEHLQILTYLGAQHAVIALTKSDLGRLDAVRHEIHNHLRDTPFANSPTVATSARTGEGIENLKDALASALSAIPPQRDIAKPRLFVDRAFALRGIGTVVTGTLTGGRLRRGQEVVVQPANLQTRIRSIQCHGLDVESAQPGMRTALNLPDLGIAQIRRGDAITIPGLGKTTSALVALVEKSARLNAESPAGRPLKNGASVYVHHGTSRVAAKILFSHDRLERGKKILARLDLASPILAFVGDRFVLRDPGQRHTVAGGMVLATEETAEIFRDTARRNALAARASAPGNVDVCVRTEIALRGGIAESQTILTQSRFGAEEISEALLRSQRDGAIILRGKIAADGALWQKLRSQAMTLIDEAHRQKPQQAGLELTELRSRMGIQAPNVFEAAIEDLCAGDFVRAGSAVARASHRPALPAALQPLAEKIRAALARKPFDPPPRREFETDPRAREVLHFLIESGNLIEISPEVVLLPETFERIKSQIAEFISKNGPATVSELRQVVGSSRRVMVPLLEKLDRHGFTRRLGDRRKLASP